MTNSLMSIGEQLGFGSGAGFRCEEREFVFDIDIDVYDDVRTCCSGRIMRNSDWAFMAAAIMVISPHFTYLDTH